MALWSFQVLIRPGAVRRAPGAADVASLGKDEV
jgi:hypothetical protein